MQKRMLVPILAAGLLSLAGCDFEEFSDAGRYKEDFHYNYPLKPGGKLYVENMNGSVEVAGWDQEVVDITGTKYASTQELRDALKIDIVASADSVRIRTIPPSDRRGNKGARYLIKVPRRTELDRIVSSNGAIRVEDIEGGARLRTSNGTVRTFRHRGSLEVNTSNGAVEVHELEGGAVLRTSNGTIRAEGIHGSFEASTSNGGIHAVLLEAGTRGAVRAETSNGSVDLTLNSVTQSGVYANTSNGSVTLRMPGSASAQVKAHTSNASISTDFPVQMQGRISKTNLEGVIGAGGPLIDLSSSNGSIRLLKM